MKEDRLIEDSQPYDLETAKQRWVDEQAERLKAKDKLLRELREAASVIAAPTVGIIQGTPADPAQQLLSKALATVTGPRRKDYGTPLENFRTIADLWTPYLRRRGLLPEGREIEPSDIAAMMALTKLARLAQSPTHYDSILDLAGYAACHAACVECEK